MIHLITYDIASDIRRHKVFELLKGYGRRVQFSVFECGLDAAEATILAAELEFEINPKEDSCRMYRICEACEPEVRVLGKGDHYSQPEFIII